MAQVCHSPALQRRAGTVPPRVSAWETGIFKIDQQHRTIAGLVTQFEAAIDADASRDRLNAALDVVYFKPDIAFFANIADDCAGPRG